METFSPEALYYFARHGNRDAMVELTHMAAGTHDVQAEKFVNKIEELGEAGAIEWQRDPPPQSKSRFGLRKFFSSLIPH